MSQEIVEVMDITADVKIKDVDARFIFETMATVNCAQCGKSMGWRGSGHTVENAYCSYHCCLARGNLMLAQPVDPQLFLGSVPRNPSKLRR